MRSVGISVLHAKVKTDDKLDGCPVRTESIYVGPKDLSHSGLFCTVIFQNFRTPEFLCCNLPKMQTKRPNLRVFYQRDANEKADSADPDQTAPLGAV